MEDDGLPEYFTWRYSGLLPRAFNQRQCDSCSSGAALNCCSSVLCINQDLNVRRARPQLFAVQEPVNRIPHVYGIGGLDLADRNGCFGIPTRLAFRYIREFQCALREHMPYSGRRTAAHPPPNHPRLFIDNYVAFQEEDVPIDNDHWPGAIIEILPEGSEGGGERVKDTIKCHPIVGKAMVGRDFIGAPNFVNRTPDFDDVAPEDVSIHAMLIVGYGTTVDGVEYYECLNSWGPNWGKIMVSALLKEQAS